METQNIVLAGFGSGSSVQLVVLAGFGPLASGGGGTGAFLRLLYPVLLEDD